MLHQEVEGEMKGLDGKWAEEAMAAKSFATVDNLKDAIVAAVSNA